MEDRKTGQESIRGNDHDFVREFLKEKYEDVDSLFARIFHSFSPDELVCLLSSVFRLTYLIFELFQHDIRAEDPEMCRNRSNVFESTRTRLYSYLQHGSLLKCIAKQGEIRCTIASIPDRVRKSHYFSSWDGLLRSALEVDTFMMVEVIYRYALQHKLLVEELQNLSPGEIEELLDVFLAASEKSSGHENLRYHVNKSVTMILNDTKHWPRSITLEGVKCLSKYPIFGGGFADIWKGRLPDGRLVALKVLRLFAPSEEEKALVHKDFCKEVIIWTQFHHHNVLPFLGICKDLFDSRLAMVMPWMENGNTLTYLKKTSSTNKLAMIYGIASGLSYLHNLKPFVVHGDLRGANILIDSEGTPQIADFGLAKVVSIFSNSEPGSHGGKGSLRWQAPELILESRFNPILKGITKATDVFAFARVCLEIFTEAVPYAGKGEGEVVASVALYFELPDRPSSVDDGIWKLITRCWEVDPADRPCMDGVILDLKTLGISPSPTVRPLIAKTNLLDLPPLPTTTTQDEVLESTDLVDCANSAVNVMKKKIEELISQRDRVFFVGHLGLGGPDPYYGALRRRLERTYQSYKESAVMSPSTADSTEDIVTLNSFLVPRSQKTPDALPFSWEMREAFEFGLDGPSEMYERWIRIAISPVTHPPLTSLRLTLRYLPWVITVQATEPHRGVTCRDFMEQVHTYLMQYVSRAEIEAQSKNRRKRIKKWFWNNRAMEAEEGDNNHICRLGPGVRRYDLLGEYTVFGGAVAEDREDVLRSLRNNHRFSGSSNFLQLVFEKRNADAVRS